MLSERVRNTRNLGDQREKGGRGQITGTKVKNRQRRSWEMGMGKKGGDTNGEMEKIYNGKGREGRKIESVMKRYVVGSCWRGRGHAGDQR